MSVAESRNMMGVIKKFDRVEHNQYDQLGRDAFRKFLDRAFVLKNVKTIDNPNEHGIDLLTLNQNDEVVHCWEIEVRHGNWQGDIKFPFNEINCIERKDHQWRRDKSFTSNIGYPLADKYKVYYVQLNRECTRAVIIDGDIILNYPLKSWKNRKSEGEYVRQIPVSKTVQVKL
jgi:hypothetical protein